jgi:3-methyladenine DNA glycosylase/8-oxoguanine DNA glycosylase
MVVAAEPGIERTFELPFPLDLGLTLGPLRHGFGDQTIRISRGEARRATRTADGPASVRIVQAGSSIRVMAWGPGAAEALDEVPALLGFHDDPAAFRPPDRLLAELHHRMPGLRIGRSGNVWQALLPAIVEQKVIGKEAGRSYQGILARYGEPAPGPLGLRLAPEAAMLAALPYYEFHPLGIEQRRADTIRRAAGVVGRLERAATLPTAEGLALLQRVAGIGPWTAAEVLRVAGGDPDIVSVGDYHLPNLVAWALAGEPSGTDERMLELLAPFAGQRGRVIRLLELSGMGLPRRAPRFAGRRIEAI